jgi:hypothetical protein
MKGHKIAKSLSCDQGHIKSRPTHNVVSGIKLADPLFRSAFTDSLLGLVFFLRFYTESRLFRHRIFFERLVKVLYCVIQAIEK